MGDYMRLSDGSQVKIGTAGDNRYMRHDEALQFLPLDHSSELQGNLEFFGADWRFPYPAEDDQDLEHVDKRSMFDIEVFTLPRELLPEKHDDVCVQIGSVARLSYGINRVLPCPLSKDDKQYGQNVATPIVAIYSERYDAAGNPRTVFACGYCQTLFSLSEEELQGYKDAFIRHHSSYKNGEYLVSEWARQIADRFHAKIV